MTDRSPNIPPHHRLSRRPLAGPRTLMAAGLALLPLALAACYSSGGMDAGRERSTQERLAALPIKDAEYGKLGYQRDWVAFPDMVGSLPVEFLVANRDVVIALEGGSTVTAFEASTGTRRWAHQVTGSTTEFRGLVRDGDMVYVASSDELFTLSLKTGNFHSRRKFERIVSSEPAQYGGALIFGTGVGELMAHQIGTMVDRAAAWRFAAGSAIEHKPVLIGDIAGAVSRGGEVLFVNAGTGAFAGSNRVYSGPSGDPAASDRAMFVASRDQSLYAFAPNGTQLWRYRTPSPLQSGPTFHAGRVYCAIPGEGMVAFDAAAGTVLWKSPGVAGTVVGVSKDRLLVWDPAGKRAILLDPRRGDMLDQAAMPGVRFIRPDAFENGNLYVVSESGVLVKLKPA